VHTISFEEVEGERADDWYTYFCEATDKRSCSGVLLDCISSALLRRRNRCASTGASGLPVPLRSFHFAFDSCHGWDQVAVDQWLFDVLRQSGKDELHLDLRFRIGPICKRRQDDDDDDKRETKEDRGWRYSLPRSLFSCAAVRSLCLSYCELNSPETVDLPFLKTLRLTGIHGDSGDIQRLVWSCPRLIDLTLEANNHLKKFTVLDKCLRRFALRCCHNITKVIIDASELRTLEYSGAVPEESLMSLSGSPGLASCTIRFCRAKPKDSEFVAFRRFLEKVSSSKHLRLHYGGLDSGFSAAFPSFSSLKRLELQGPIQSSDTVHAILECTPNLEVLSLYMETDQQTREGDPFMYQRFDELDDDEELERPIVLDNLLVSDESSFSMSCLQHSVKEINMVNYQCDVHHRTLASLLFRNALVLERMCVVFGKGQFALQSELKKEIESWLVAKPGKSFM
jgi:hypothetical protein